jgi:hypothetical protein
VARTPTPGASRSLVPVAMPRPRIRSLARRAGGKPTDSQTSSVWRWDSMGSQQIQSGKLLSPRGTESVNQGAVPWPGSSRCLLTALIHATSGSSRSRVVVVALTRAILARGSWAIPCHSECLVQLSLRVLDGRHEHDIVRDRVVQRVRGSRDSAVVTRSLGEGNESER